MKHFALFVLFQCLCIVQGLKSDSYWSASTVSASLDEQGQAGPVETSPAMGTSMPAPKESNSPDTTDLSKPSRIFGGTDLSVVDKDFIFEGLKKLYKRKVLPLEIASKFSHFQSPPMGPSDFDAKPMVLILGQYSVGKTSFIRSLLKQDFPGQRIGPEPTTDRFMALMHSGPDGVERSFPGHALVMQGDKPFRGLASFGNNFLSKFEGSEVNAAILSNVTIVDTPGVLAGEKQRIGRDYDFTEVVKWFAERADMIIIMFDAHKLDISDELRMVLDTLRLHQEKIRVLLNKADTMEPQALLRVYGALMWSLGKVVQTPEACRVYLGSFWEAPLKRADNRALLQREKDDLLSEMMSLPQNAIVRRINDLVKRARAVKVHAYIIHYLRKQMPYMMGKSEKQKRLIDRLDKEFIACARRYNLPLGDFPNVDKYRKMLREVKDISDFKRLDKNLVYEMDRVLTHDIPMLLQKATGKSPPSPMSELKEDVGLAPSPQQWAGYQAQLAHHQQQQRQHGGRMQGQSSQQQSGY
jgi:GTPase SAR1 family protein